MIVTFIDSLSTYDRYEETIEQTDEYNGQDCNMEQRISNEAL